MRKKLIAFLAAAMVLGASGVPSAGAGTSLGGESSDNVEWLKHVPFDAVTGTGARLVGDLLYVTSWRAFSIYDVSDAMNPALLSTTPFGFAFENEDVATNGKILLFSESLPQNILHIWDVEDPTLPVQIAQLPGAGDHTMSCILDCDWGYGSDGSIVDLRNPSSPKLAGDWHELIGLTDDGHDVEEFKKGFVIISTISSPLLALDVRNPLKPKVLAQGEHPDPASWLFHSARWPNKGKDRFLLMEGEGTNGPFLTYDTTGWKKKRSFELIDSWSPSSASSHWFQEHPDFHNGGLVTVAWYGEGTQILEVKPDGTIEQVGWFRGHAGDAFSSYWMGDDLIYHVDLYRGIDILRLHPD
ncbi:MAG TPA: hypothetical protein VNC78_04785 [Actinomycetota bacterium]|nr:hypothetical protein [Actinomycetota bacterium]